MEKEDFEKLVKKALKELPEKIRQKMDNVALCIEERPNKEQLRKTGVKLGSQLLGLYQGVPQTKWGRSFGMRLPDKITIFQEPIERLGVWRPERIKELVKYTVWHEIAHLFGFDEKEIRKLETKWKRLKA